MNIGKIVLKVVDLLFAGAELLVTIHDKLAKKPPPKGSTLQLKDLLEMKRADDDRLRRSQAPTVAIPPPSQRHAIPPPPPRKRS